eukprot:13077322-Heterocapsa_arctica.AAC.1
MWRILSTTLHWLKSMSGSPNLTAWWPFCTNHSANRDSGSHAHSSRHHFCWLSSFTFGLSALSGSTTASK